MPKKLTLFLLCCALSGAALAQPSGSEASLKAVFIYNFTRYIEWDSTSNADHDFVIGVIGTSPVANALIEIASNNRVNNKRIFIQRFNKPEEINHCQILFIPQHCPYSLPSILSKVGKGVLTVGEEPGMAKQGMAMNFVLVKDKLKFEANLKTLFLAGLKASSQLLKLAIIVD